MSGRTAISRALVTRVFALSVVLFILLAGAAAAAPSPVVLDYSFTAPTIVQQPDRTDSVAVAGLPSWGAPGAPVLPYRTGYVLLPYGSEAADVSVTAAQWVALPGTYRVEPGRKPVPLSSKGPIARTPPNPAIYSSSAPFPAQPWGPISVQRWRGHAIVVANLFPVRYLPAAGIVQWCNRLRITVKLRARTAAESAALLPVRRAGADARYLQRHVDTPELLTTYASASASPAPRTLLDPEPAYDYVIITSNALANAAGAYTFQNLVAQKVAQGIPATIVTTEWIYANYSGTRPGGGSDNQTRIRNFIIDAYQTWGTHYALLGGDGDAANVGGESGNQIIPHRGFAVYDDADIPADMYYGCLDGTFDNNANGFYGEPNDGVGGGEVDLLAEVHVGRAPVDSDAEVSDFVHKTLAYAAAAPPQDVWMVGEYLGFGGVADWGGNYKDEIKNGTDLYGYTTVGFLNAPSAPAYDVSTLYDRDDPGNDWPPSQLIGIINGGVHLINHLGHANNTYVMKLGNADVDGFTNTKYFVGYSQGCYAGAFDNRDDWGDYLSEDCIAEHLVCSAHGAAAFIACSRYGWGVGESTDGPSQHFDREFWDAVLGEGIIEIGAANDDSKWDQAGYVAADEIGRWCCYELTLFGDPQLMIKVISSQGRVSLDREYYRVTDNALITVVDADLDLNPSSPDTVVVNIKSTTESTPEAVTCTETGNSTCIFVGSIDLRPGAPAPDGTLQVANLNLVTVTYHDADDGTHHAVDVTDLAWIDATPPVIANIQVSQITDTSARVTWITNEASRSTVSYGATIPPGSQVSSSDLVTSHAIALTDLIGLTTYHFSVTSTDEAGNAATDDNAGAYYSFVTLESPKRMYSWTLDTNPGWNCGFGWQFGQPLGLGSGPGDPTSGHTGLNVYGYNLNGDYPDNMPAIYLNTAAIDCSSLTSVQLKFWRWLGVEDSYWDHAAVELSTNGSTWSTVWDHTGETIWDTEWTEQTFDISARADGQATVYLRWRMGPSDYMVTYCGWNIDDIEIWGILHTIFLDVPTAFWARPYIEAIYREGITGGCAADPLRYCPTSEITRGQMAVFLCKAAGKTQLISPTPRFTDVPPTHTFYGWIERLADADSWGGTPPTTGCTATEFCPTAKTTRGQMAAFLCRATGQAPLIPSTPTFNDVPDTHPFYGWIERLADPGSWTAPPTTGCNPVPPPRLFCPANTCKRGEMAIFLCRAFDIPY